MGMCGGAGGLWLPEMVDLSGGDQELLEPGAASRGISWDEVRRPSQYTYKHARAPHNT
jgi:hypothetical protein